MAMQLNPNENEPSPRSGHQTIIVGNRVYMWAGLVNGMPIAHDIPEKRRFLSSVEVFLTDSGEWTRLPTSGVPPLGVCGYGCAAVDDSIYYFGGVCGHGNACFHNSLHKLSTPSMHWDLISPTALQEGLPMRKSGCGMVAFNDVEDILYIVGGLGPSGSYRQPGSAYRVAGNYIRSNEQHMFTPSTRIWSSPNVVGQVPYPTDECTFTQVGERRAALFGGRTGSKDVGDDLLIVDLSRISVQWTKIKKPIATVLPLLQFSREWPENRYSHAATCMNGSLLVITGGSRKAQTIVSDFCICDLNTFRWNKLSLPNFVTERICHSVSALQLSPHSVLLIVFGGQNSVKLSHTALIELIQGGDLQWEVSWILDGIDKIAYRYQQVLSNWKINQGVIHQLQEEKMKIEQRLIREKEQLQFHLHDIEDTLSQVMQQNQQWSKKIKQLTITNEQLEKRLQTANAQSQQQIHQLRQQLSDMRITEDQDSVEQPHWVVRREEIELTEEELGRGGWGEVKVAKFRGLRVAAKILYNVILSEYNQRQFTREMMIAAKIRHPNLLLFIGATREGDAVILTELMPTSLRRELEKTDMPQVQIISIAKDVACALRYLHQWRPSPIIHRDVSSANVLLELLSSGWRAKVSDFGSANFMNSVATVAPGSPVYAAPEAQYPGQHSPKMDTFSYGVLLIEMYVRELPDSCPVQREAQILQIQWAAIVSLVRRCTSERPADRPSMIDIMELLVSMSEQ